MRRTREESKDAFPLGAATTPRCSRFTLSACERRNPVGLLFKPRCQPHTSIRLDSNTRRNRRSNAFIVLLPWVIRKSNDDGGIYRRSNDSLTTW
jgi:hypothetical protein